jgi:thiamine-monophosphate kinase
VEGVGLEAIRYGVVVVGGNLARSPDRLIVDVTMLGEADPGQVLYRDGARAGDRILVTGTLGDSAAGLVLLQAGKNAIDIDAQYLIGRHRLPTPRIEAGRAIARSGLASAMIDLSDGLASDVAHLAGASVVGAVVAASAVPLSPELRRFAGSTERDPLDWALRGGEDYELLLTAAPVSVQPLIELVAVAGARLTDIGEVTSSRALRLLQPDGTSMELGNGSWHHWSR